MNELTDVLTRQAAQARPVPNLGDVHQRADQRRRRARAGRISLIAAPVVGVLVGLLAVATIRPASDGTKAASNEPPAEVPISSVGGLVISGAGVDGSYPQTGLERSDPDAGSGPYAVVVRRVDGQLGAASAVITYPVADDLSSGTNLSTLLVSRPGGRIRVRSVSLDADEVTAIANATEVIDGRPVVSLPASMDKYAVVAVGTERPAAIHETRYGCDAVGEAAALGGLCYTGLTTSVGFEDALYGRGYQPGPLVQGHPSVVSTVGGGNATLAWEPQPGLILTSATRETHSPAGRWTLSPDWPTAAPSSPQRRGRPPGRRWSPNPTTGEKRLRLDLHQRKAFVVERLAGVDRLVGRRVQPRPGRESGVTTEIAKAHCTPSRRGATCGTGGRMQRSVVEREHIAGLHVERHDLVLVAHRLDVGNELEAVGIGDVRRLIDELARNESTTPQV